jgi:hypothetical protein
MLCRRLLRRHFGGGGRDRRRLDSRGFGRGFDWRRFMSFGARWRRSSHFMPAVGRVRLRGFKMGRGQRWLNFKFGCKLRFGSGWRLQKWGREVVLPLRFNLKNERITRGRRRLGRGRPGLGMAATHDGFIKSLFDDLTRGRFQHHLMAQDRRTIGLFVEVRFDPVGLLGSQQARIQAPVS